MMEALGREVEWVAVRSACGGEANGVGLWFRVFVEAFPQRPAEDEVELRDERSRDQFLEQALAFAGDNMHNDRAKSAKRVSEK